MLCFFDVSAKPLLLLYTLNKQRDPRGNTYTMRSIVYVLPRGAFAAKLRVAAQQRPPYSLPMGKDTSFKRVNNFLTAGSSGLVFKIYFAKKRDLTTCFSTFFFQVFVLMFFFDLLVRFC